MSRLSQANQLWAALLGSGRGTAGRRRIVQQNAGALPVTSEVIAAATHGMGDAGRRAYLEQLLQTPHGHGGGARTPHYGPLSGGTSEIHFEDHGTGETFDQVALNPADQAELAQRAAIQQEAIDAELIGQFGGILGGEYDRQPAAFAEVYRPAITAFASGQMPSAETDAIIMSRRRKEGAQRAAIGDYLSQHAGAMSEGEVADLWQQHYQQYPEFSEGQQPPQTREEQIAQKRTEEEETFRGMLDEFTTANGLGSIPVRRNEKGVLEPIVNIETMVSNNRQLAAQSEATTVRNATAAFNARMKVLKGQLPAKPHVTAPPSEQQAWQQLFDQNQAEQQAAFEEFNRAIAPGGAAPESFTPPAPADTPQQLPPVDLESGPAAERAFDNGRIVPGQPFRIDGVLFYFDENGIAQRG